MYVFEELPSDKFSVSGGKCDMQYGIDQLGLVNLWRQRTDDHFDDPRYRLPAI
jgi:hypothetical protein